MVTQGNFLLSGSNFVLYIVKREDAISAGILLSNVLRRATVVRFVGGETGYTVQPETEAPVIRGAQTIKICTPDE